MDPFIGQILHVGFRYAPVNWLLCNGATMQISQNNALFALLGNTFGGNGTSTFALPDAQGRAFVGTGQGPGLTPRLPGAKGGYETVSLNTAQLPMHNHGATLTMTGNPTVQGTLAALAGATVPNESAAPQDGSYLGTVQDPDAAPVLYVPAAKASQPGIVPVALAGIGGTVTGIGGTVIVQPNGSSAPVGVMPPFLAVTTIIASVGIWPENPN
jgi:microcystin-dependent protein